MSGLHKLSKTTKIITAAMAALIVICLAIAYYCNKIIVKGNSLLAETAAVITTKSTIDGGYFSMNNHLHTFSFDGKDFIPENDFMFMDENIYGLDESTYFNVDALCYYARELSVLTEPQIDKIDAYEPTRIIGENRYISLIDLRNVKIFSEIGWELSSHTPVCFSTQEPDITT